MKFTTLGRTGITVSRQCFGVMMFGKQADEQASAGMFQRCLDAGINFFDCANVYAEGRSEEILGRLMKGRRDKLIITSKVGFGVSAAANDSGLSRRHILMQIEASLRRLGTDWLDVYFCHCLDPKTPLEETLAAMDDLLRQGKIRHIGVSNWPAWKIARSLGISENHGWAAVQILQPMYNLAKRTAEIEILPLAQAENLGVISFSPLGGGLLTGQSTGKQATADSRLIANKMYAIRYGAPVYSQITERFVAYAASVNVHPATLAIAWVMAHPAITAPILGARTVEQLDPALAAADYILSPAQYQEITALTPPVPVASDRDEERAKT